ncbi:MAG: hypothetical protein KAF24_04805 [Nitrosopumilaceae archaeon]|nr:hypothetical protein [Nitrosopumilaceae archaeon]
MQIDKNKNIYVFLHGKLGLKQKSINALTKNGFDTNKIVLATPNKVGNVGDYMAMLWFPNSPTHIKIQQISSISPLTSDGGIMGLWAGVTKNELFTIDLDD